MGVHPVRARKMTQAFEDNEKAHDDELFDAWKEIEEGIHFSPRYGELFMKLEEALGRAMAQSEDPGLPEELTWEAPVDNKTDR